MKLRFLDPVLLTVVPYLASTYSNIMGCSSKTIIIGPHGVSCRREFFDWPHGVIYCTWHSRFFYFSFHGRGKDVFTMISPSKDGEVITRTIRRMRLYSVRGSSSKRGHEALYEATTVLQQNHKLFMLPDGPRGPRYQAKPGTIRLAQLTGRPILPLSFSTTHGIFFPSWDHFLLPLPFGKAVVTFGQPIYIQANLSEEEFENERHHLEKVLNELRIESDRLCGRDSETESQNLARLDKKKKT
jgi:lysophospholipid acyltransferase (LPLAT)-like uncharacterized protein